MKKIGMMVGIVVFVIVVGAVLVWWLVPRYPVAYQGEISSAAERYQLSSSLVMAVVYAESGFKPNAESKKGAIGLMQLMPETASWVAQELNVEQYDLKDPNVNLEFGCYYLKYLFGRFVGLEEVLAAYNAGEGRVREWKAMYGAEWEKNIPFSETRAYIKKIQKAQSYYQKKLS